MAGKRQIKQTDKRYCYNNIALCIKLASTVRPTMPTRNKSDVQVFAELLIGRRMSTAMLEIDTRGELCAITSCCISTPV